MNLVSDRVRAIFSPAVACAFLLQVVLLWVAAGANSLWMNPDGIVYLRHAEYLAAGNWPLFVNGYWGPLFSTLIAAIEVFGAAPLIAARAAIAISAVAFLGAAFWLLSCSGLSRRSVVGGTWLVALTTVAWSGGEITPDLLLGAFLCAFAALVLDEKWPRSSGRALLSGAILGIAYLTKAIALPLGIAVLLLFAFLHRRRTKTSVLRSVALALLATLTFSLPWIVAISMKYGRPIYSTTGPIAHAVKGPNSPRNHPSVLMIHRPEPGRVVSLEDPSLLPYAYWSPFKDRASAAYQWKLIVENLEVTGSFFMGFAWAGLAIVAPLLALALSIVQRRFAADRWRWLMVPLALTVAAYALVFANAERYFFSCFIFVLILAFGVAEELASRVSKPERARLIAAASVCALFLAPQLPRIAETLEGGINPGSRLAHELAGRVERSGLSGPVVGGGVDSDHAGIYLAYLLDQPWYGDLRTFDADAFADAGARLLVVPRRLGYVRPLSARADVRDLDPVLFASTAEAAGYPLKIFERIPQHDRFRQE